MFGCGLLILAGCNPHPLKGVSTTYSAAGSSDVALEVDHKVDILIVIDDSGSMAEEQAKLAANFGPFIEKLEGAGADYRIAVTTTDDGGYTCNTSAEGGRFVATSCLDREADFGDAETFALACEAHCSLTTEQLGVEATALEAGGELAPRPWIESFKGKGNLPEGVSALEAFQCLAPQGVAGCGFERQLESMARGLRRAESAAEAEHGFLRPGANLLVMIVTDEADCSYNKSFETELFDFEGPGQFFEPGYSYATGAVCWNASVACEGAEDGYTSCQSVELGADGQPTSDLASAMLTPVSGYVQELAALATDREVMVSVIAGVPEGYAAGEAALSYREPADPDTARDYGIDFGCHSGSGDQLQVAVPPVRLREFAESFAGDAPNLFSVCADDYTPALTQIVDSLLAEFGPACFDACALDVDPELEGVQPSCKIIEERSEQDLRYLPQCEFDGQDFTLPSDADACWIVHNDEDGRTATTADDLAPECQVEGQNLQFELLRRPGVAVAGGTEVRAECELAAFPSLACPGFE